MTRPKVPAVSRPCPACNAIFAPDMRYIVNDLTVCPTCAEYGMRCARAHSFNVN